MPVFRVNVAIGSDGPLAKDRLLMTPHFTGAGPSDWHAANDAFATALSSWIGTPAREVKVTTYSAEGPPPHYPIDTASANVDSFPAGIAPRELALCLSFYSGSNVPRRRGRMYVPTAIFTAALSGVRPSVAQQNKVAALVPLLTNYGGTTLAHCVYSRADSQAFPVTNYYVDDEWDVIRSRGLRPVSRVTASP